MVENEVWCEIELLGSQRAEMCKHINAKIIRDH